MASGVCPVLVALSTAAPAASSRGTTPAWPLMLANKSGALVGVIATFNSSWRYYSYSKPLGADR
eukprot:7366625-Prymnesium_polylepis.1